MANVDLTLVLGSEAPAVQRERFCQLGLALLSSVRLQVAVPTSCSQPAAALPYVAYESEHALRQIVEGCEIAIVPGSLFDTYPGLASTSAAVVIDLDRREISVSRVRAASLLLCHGESDRDWWSTALAAQNGGRHASVSLAVVEDPGSYGATAQALWEAAVDPLRLFCTTRLRRPQRMWTEGLAARVFRLVRDGSVIPLARKVLTRVRGRFGVRPSPGRASKIVARLAQARTLTDFQHLAAQEDLASSSERFMDLEIDLSNKCNIRCRMCYFSFDETFRTRPVYLQPDVFAPLADSILPHARAVMLSLGNEPLTSPYFTRILELAGTHRVPELGFYTNGLLMSEPIIDAMLTHGVSLVAISVDGATKATFESIRVGADFDRVLSNVRTLVRRRREAGQQRPRVRFNVVMMRRNVEELADIVTLAWRLGVEEVNFFHAVIYDGLRMDGESLSDHKALSNRCLQRALTRAAKLGIVVAHSPALFGAEDVSAGPRGGTPASQRWPYCRFPFFHVSINAARQVLPCPFSHGEAAFGVVGPERTFEHVWLGPEFTNLRRRILMNDPPAMCRRCSFLASSQPDHPGLFVSRPN
jgi:MoaA/NifB/PqqE/SkfB family radical SAM enzyme